MNSQNNKSDGTIEIEIDLGEVCAEGTLKSVVYYGRFTFAFLPAIFYSAGNRSGGIILTLYNLRRPHSKEAVLICW